LFESIQAVKTTLTGDFTHIEEAIAKTLEFISANQFVVDSTFSRLEVYRSGKTEIKNPSKWLTEIYIPVKPKAIKVATANIPLDTNNIKKEKIIETPKKEKITITPKKDKVNLIPKKEKVIATPKKDIEIPSEF
jgi:hypothetical protein